MSRFVVCIRAAASALALVLLLTLPAAAQLTSDGRYKGPLDQLNDPTDAGHPYSFRGIHAACFGSQRQGASVGGDYGDSYGGGETIASNDSGAGYWAVSDVLEGSYAIAFARIREFPRALFYNLNAGAKYVRYRNTPEYYPSAVFWRAPALFFGQQFQAFGSSVTSVSARVPGQFTPVRVTIHDGDINGPQIGPARLLVTNFADDNAACWSAGEVPTVPGHYYTAKFVNADDEFGAQSLQLFYSPGQCLAGDCFYGGKSWIADPVTNEPVEVAEPLKTVVGMDTDGITSTVYTSTAYLNEYLGATRMVPVNAGMCGQTFTARGNSVLAADFRIWNPCYVGGQLFIPDMQVAVFEGPGPDGTGVNQIGPTKYARTNWGINNGRTVVTWYPGEVPVAAGQSYYLRITPVPDSPGGFFQLWVTNEDEYAGGHAYLGQAFPLTPQAYDLSCMILEETSPGSATMAKVNLTNKSGAEFSSPDCTLRGSTTALIEWATPYTNSTGKLEYGSEKPYTDSVIVSTPSAAHSVTLTGLKPATLYHCRITAAAPGKRDAVSKDFAFFTEPETPNLLTNGDFETGSLTGWTLFGRRLPGLRNDRFVGDIRPHTGTYYVGGAWNDSPNTSPAGGAFQTVTVDPMQPVTLRGWLYTFQGYPAHDVNFSARYDSMCLGRIGIDPTGGTNPAASSVVWSMASSGQDWYDPNATGKYVDLALTVQPQSSSVTVFAEAGQIQIPGEAVPAQFGYCAYAWDDFHLSQAGVTQVEHLGDLTGLPDGLFVELHNLVVSANPIDAGAHYVQSLDRASGIRVESEDFLMRGTQATVQGRLSTRPSGERYLANATFTDQVPVSSPDALTTRVQWIGSTAMGLNNTGLLMRTTGVVTAIGSGFVMIGDGSPVADLKVDLTSAGGSYSVGQALCVIGVVQSELASPSTVKPVLRARDSADITVVN